MQLITPPAVRPPLVSLLSASTTGPTITRVPESAGFLSVGCGGWRVRAICDDSVVEESPVGMCDEVGGQSFLVETEIGPVSTMGLDRAELDRRLLERLDAVTSAAIADELWTGRLIAAVGDPAALDHPTFQGAATPDGTAARDPKRALAVLEDYLGDLLDGPPGAIHATRGGAVVLPEKVRAGPNSIQTSVGTTVIPDAGYPGTSPSGATPAAGTTWMYASSVPVVSLGPVDTYDAMVRADNSVTVKAVRAAWVAFECGPAAVLMNLV